MLPTEEAGLAWCLAEALGLKYSESDAKADLAGCASRREAVIEALRCQTRVLQPRVHCPMPCAVSSTSSYLERE